MKKTIRKAFKYRLKPTPEQSQKMTGFAGCNRFVWNKALAMNLFRLENKQPILWYQEMAYWLKLWKESDEYGFLADCHSQVLQQKLKDLDKAFKDGFDKTQPLKRMPVFKKKGLGDRFRYPQGFKLEQDKSQIFLPKIGWVKYYHSQKAIGEAKNLTISRRGKHWYVSVQVEYEADIPNHQSTSIVGIDMGVNRFATLSDGTSIEPLNRFRKLEKKLAWYQRNLARKVKFSANWDKQKQKISTLHEKIANSRLDYLHKASTAICKNQAMIVVEDLKVRNMSKSSRGDADNPGRSVKAKSGLNKSILDQGWSMFVSMLEYKQSWLGGNVLKVPAHHTSQTCPCCGHVAKANRQTQSRFECVECGYTQNADRVGALNILARGHRVLAGGELALATH